MTNPYSTPIKLANLYQELAKVCQSQLDLPISASKMADDAEYCKLVIAELTALGHPPVSALLDKIAALQQSPVDTPVAQNKKPMWPLFSALAAFSLMLVAVLWFVLQPTAPSTVQTRNAAPAVATPAPTVASQPVATLAPSTATSTPSATVSQNDNAILRLHGSNTIGEKLAPALVEAFLKQRGITDFQWQQQHPLERSVHFNWQGKPAFIELHAHGSSTAFKDLAAATTDIGMASRPAKMDEVIALRPTLGNLKNPSQEHIVGLDGLAVIVNRNNPVAQLDVATLASIFAGDITNWRQLGGEDQAIVIHARDDNSGTFDTFKHLVLSPFRKKLHQSAKRYESNSELSEQVAMDDAAIGFVGLNYIAPSKAIAIAETADSSAIYPTRFTIGTEDYPLARRLYFYNGQAVSSFAQDFVQFALSQNGQALVEQHGLVSQNIKLEPAFKVPGAPTKYNQYAESSQRLSMNFRFNYGENTLDNKGQRDVSRLVDFMAEHPGRRLVLMGFSDASGNQEKNEQLAMARAQMIERELQARGIAVLAVESFGSALPIANNNTEDGRAKNRRVEVWLL